MSKKKVQVQPQRLINPILALAVRVQEIVNDEIRAFAAAGPGHEPMRSRCEELQQLAEAAFRAGVQAGIDIPLLHDRILATVKSAEAVMVAGSDGIFGPDHPDPKPRPRPLPEDLPKPCKEKKAIAEEEERLWRGRMDTPVSEAKKAWESLLVLSSAWEAKQQVSPDDAHRVRPRIPPDRRTRPLGMAEAAKLMGYTKNRKTPQAAVKALRRIMDDGGIKFEKYNRQQYIFNRDSFPPESQSQLAPKEK